MLSPSSQQSLELQGGPASPEEARTLEANPLFEGVVMLRRWDDAAKVPGLKLPDFEHYRNLINSLIL
jgi:predicted HD phosphohydrolase